jgi:hypothetical protein
MELIIVLVLGLVAFDAAALRWGSDSTDKLGSPEWDRRHHWRAFGGD